LFPYFIDAEHNIFPKIMWHVVINVQCHCQNPWGG